MSWIDAAIVIIFLFFIVTAFQAGFIRETIGMGSAIVGVVCGGLFYQDISDSLLTSIDNETTKSVVSFLIIFGTITIVGQLIAMLVQPAIVVMQLGIFDQLLGAVFGAIKGFVIIEALLILMITFPRFDMDEKIDDSEFANIMLDISEPMLQILPNEFDVSVDAFLESGGPRVEPPKTLDP